MTLTSGSPASRPIRYPVLRLNDFKVFIDHIRAPFFFDDVQAATGLNLTDGRKAMNMLRAAGLIERVDERPKPRYLVRTPMIELTSGAVLQGVHRSSVALDTLPSAVGAYNALGLPLKIWEVRVVTVVRGASETAQEVQAHVVVQTKKDVSRGLVEIQRKLMAVTGGPVSVVLEWRL